MYWFKREVLYFDYEKKGRYFNRIMCKKTKLEHSPDDLHSINKNDNIEFLKTGRVGPKYQGKLYNGIIYTVDKVYRLIKLWDAKYKCKHTTRY